MQDNDNLNEEFTDFAWSKMSNLLDQEMPVKKKKRRRMVLWLLFGLLLGIGSSAYYFGARTKELDANSKSVLPIVKAKPSAAKEIPTPPHHSIAETNATNEITKSIEPIATNAITNEIKSDAKAIITAPNKIIANPVKNNRKIAAVNLQNDIEAKVVIPSESAAISSKAILPEKIENAVVQATGTKLLVRPSEDLPTSTSTAGMVAIKRLEINPLGFEQRAGLILPVFENTNSALRYQPTLLGGSIYGGFQHNNRSSALGGRLGIDLIYQLRPKLVLTIGLAYQRLKNNYALNIAKVQDGDFSLSSEAYRGFFDDGLNEYYSQDPLSLEENREKIFLQMEYFDFVSLPIQFLFQMDPKWQVGVGVDLAYLVNMRGRHLYNQKSFESSFQLEGHGSPIVLGVGGNGVGGSTGDLQKRLDELEGANLLDQLNEADLAFRKWSLGSSVGLSYSPISQLGIDLRYHFGLTNMIKDDVFGEGFYNRSLSLTLAYKF